LIETPAPDTRQKILDTAERLFATNGYHPTSLRKITSEAGVNLAAVNYHFGSKERLLQELFTRRLLPLNLLRQERLEEVSAVAARENRPPLLEDLLRAFFETTVLYCTREPGAIHFSTLVGRTLAEPDDQVRSLFMDHLVPIFNLLLDLVEQALPDLDRKALFWRLQFAIGSTTHTMRLYGKLHQLQNTKSEPPSIEELLEQLLEFICKGVGQS